MIAGFVFLFAARTARVGLQIRKKTQTTGKRTGRFIKIALLDSYPGHSHLIWLYLSFVMFNLVLGEVI
jgi:hypothetical protein